MNINELVMTKLPGQTRTKAVHEKPPLEDFAIVEDGKLYWWASWYAKVLGYKSLRTFDNPLHKAKDTCVDLHIPLNENFIPAIRIDGDKKKSDYKLSKFFCFLVSIHSDGRKPVVKRARMYFLNELEELHIHLDKDDYFERRALRDSLRESTIDLNKVARRARVKSIRDFVNEGYLGLYNQPINETKRRRGIPEKEDIYDYMGMTELSANLFRISLTEERLRKMSNPSHEKATREHWKISSKIRTLIKENTGTYPEFLQFEASLEKIENSLKQAQKMLNSEIKKNARQMKLKEEEE